MSSSGMSSPRRDSRILVGLRRKVVNPGSSRTGHLIFSLNIYRRQEPVKGSVCRQILGSKVFSVDAKNKEKTVAWRNGSAVKHPEHPQGS